MDANKVFALFLRSDSHESNAAYKKLCDKGLGIEDVAHKVGNKWVSNYGGYEFTVSELKKSVGNHGSN